MLEAGPRPTPMADLVRRCEDPHSIRLERSRSFFEWRYRNPLSHYHFLYAESDPLEGYLVLRSGCSNASMECGSWTGRLLILRCSNCS